MSDDLLVAAEVAAMCRIDSDTPYTWRRRKVGPPSFRLNGRVVWRRSVVEAWIADQEKAAS